MVPLVDALGSVLALADANGNITTQYTYDPFGGTTASGTASANPVQYIGQENDLTGLYYFHARYYNPALHRFISEDPLGFGGGDVNLHAYALNSPSNFRDPSGKSVPLACAIGGAGNTVLNWVADKLTGRKITLANSADYFISGCKTGVIMEITGLNWVIGKAFSGIASAAGWAAGKLFTGEIEASVEATVGEGASAGGTNAGVPSGELPSELQQMVQDTNPTGSTSNCLNCALALDNTLAGNATSAVPSDLTPLSLSGFTSTTVDAIEQQLLEAGAGARGIVVGTNGGIAHVFNAVNYNGVVYFVDGQSGTIANTEFLYIYFLRRF